MRILGPGHLASTLPESLGLRGDRWQFPRFADAVPCLPHLFLVFNFFRLALKSVPLVLPRPLPQGLQCIRLRVAGFYYLRGFSSLNDEFPLSFGCDARKRVRA